VFSSRTAIALLVGAAILAAVSVAYNLLKTPDHGGFARDSFGTTAHGQRGIYETLERLDVPVSRSLLPPPIGLNSNDVLAILSPDMDLADHEPEHLRRTAEWVEKGGTLIVALASGELNQSKQRRHGARRGKEPRSTDTLHSERDYQSRRHDTEISQADLLENLGLPRLNVARIALKFRPAASADADAKHEQQQREESYGFKLNQERSTGLTWPTFTGEFQRLKSEVAEMRLPVTDLQVFETSTPLSAALGTIDIRSRDDVGYTLAAKFRRGAGAITVVTDEALFYNHLLDKADNSVAVVRLLTPSGNGLVFDEFYHGLGARGNPFWLLTQPHYGWIFLFMLLAVGLAVWRAASPFGPPIAGPLPGRRTLIEYLDAMAVMFTRAKQHRYVLAELREGVLWAIHDQLHLPPGRPDAEQLATVLERRDAVRAEKLRRANQQVDKLLRQAKPVSTQEFMAAAKEMDQCL